MIAICCEAMPMSLESSIKSDFWHATPSWTGKSLHLRCALKGNDTPYHLRILGKYQSQRALIALNLEGVLGIYSLIGFD